MCILSWFPLQQWLLRLSSILLHNFTVQLSLMSSTGLPRTSGHVKSSTTHYTVLNWNNMHGTQRFICPQFPSRLSTTPYASCTPWCNRVERRTYEIQGLRQHQYSAIQWKLIEFGRIINHVVLRETVQCALPVASSPHQTTSWITNFIYNTRRTMIFLLHTHSHTQTQLH